RCPLALVATAKADSRVSGPRQGSAMLGPRGAGHHPPSVPVRTPPGQLRRAEHLALLIAEEGHVAGRFDLLPQAVRQAARLEDDVAELPGREEAVQLIEPVQAPPDGLMADLGLEADAGLVHAIEHPQRGRVPLLER